MTGILVLRAGANDPDFPLTRTEREEGFSFPVFSGHENFPLRRRFDSPTDDSWTIPFSSKYLGNKDVQFRQTVENINNGISGRINFSPSYRIQFSISIDLHVSLPSAELTVKVSNGWKFEDLRVKRFENFNVTIIEITIAAIVRFIDHTLQFQCRAFRNRNRRVFFEMRGVYLNPLTIQRPPDSSPAGTQEKRSGEESEARSCVCETAINGVEVLTAR